MKKVSKLGDGTYGTVYSARSPGKGLYAVKRNYTPDDVSFVGAIRETDTLVKFNGHPHIVDLQKVLYGSPFGASQMSPVSKKEHDSQKQDKFHYVFPQADFDSKKMILRRRNTVASIERYLLHAMLGLSYLHANNYAHRDIKPENILIYEGEKDIYGQSGLAKLCDFGFVKPLCTQTTNTPGVITHWYRPPEIIGEGDYGLKCDVWSMGCVMYEMLTGKPLFNSGAVDIKSATIDCIVLSHPDININTNVRVMHPKYVRNIPQIVNLNKKKSRPSWEAIGRKIYTNEKKVAQFADLMRGMLEIDPDRRMTITEAVNHEFFSSHSKYTSKVLDNYGKIEEDGRVNYDLCFERGVMAKLAVEIFNKRTMLKHWYTDRILFHAINIFDRYLMYKRKVILDKSKKIVPRDSSDRGIVFNIEEAVLCFWVCIYVSVKYFSSLHIPERFTAIVSSNDPDIIFAEEIELEIVTSALKYRIYEGTLYEAAERPLTSDEVRDLLLIYVLNPNIRGKPITEIINNYLTNVSGEGMTSPSLIKYEF